MRKAKILLILCMLTTVFTVFAGELGDVDNDSEITIVDALLVAQYYVGISTQPIVTENADVNADGYVDILDALLIAQYFVGLIDTFPGAASPDGILTKTTGCKSIGATDGKVSYSMALDPVNVSTSEECLQYQYDPDSLVLNLRHVNAGFNCCPEFKLERMEISDGYIRISTSEGQWALCDCECLFDLDYEITGLLPGVYTIVTKSYGDPMEITVDLTTEPAGIFCFPRDHYPWN